MVVGEVYGSARKIVPVVGVASRGSYGASKASNASLVGKPYGMHAGSGDRYRMSWEIVGVKCKVCISPVS